MASKYARLKGKVPEQETERDQAINEFLAEWRNDSLAVLTEAYNKACTDGDELAAKVKKTNQRIDALEILIRRRLDAEDADSVGMHGFTWSEKFEPYPVAEDPVAIVKYFKDNELEDQLALTNSELAGRLKKYVKEEALANELVVVTKQVDDPDAPGGTREVTEVRSHIPGVRVFLKAGLSRVKSKGVKA